MCRRLVVIVCLLIAARWGDALTAEHRSNNRYVKLPVVHSTNQQVFSKVYQNKRDVSTVPLAKRADVAYYARLNIGSPPQPVYVQLDTGSFELWVNPDCSNLKGMSEVRFCRAVGQYDPSSSSTSAELTTGKILKYGIGSAYIRYVTDTIGLAGTDTILKDVQFGVAIETVDEFAGILGIGHGENITIRYRNMVDQLAAQGATNTKAFSLALGSKDEQEGVIVFGGLDTSKFAGTLQTQPIIAAKHSPDGVQRYWIDMASLTLVPPSGEPVEYINTTMTVFLDSGSTLTLLPTELADTIAADFGAGPANELGFYTVDCDLNNQPGMLDFGFNGVTIHVPYRELVREVLTDAGVECFLGISPSTKFSLLGDTMLRSAYAVFDQTNSAIHLAQYTNCGSNEREITANTNFTATTGDCQHPDLLSPAGNWGSASGMDESDSKASAHIRADLVSWAAFWAIVYTSILSNRIF
ncbi:eukaryotic aspartyl protease [Poronia punctata]|nr:eukaryotic aspartyl protease [Poronia punctata]